MTYHVEDVRAAIRAAIEADDDRYSYYGIRFEDMARKVGDICGCSKDNPGREDAREFPEYGTPEYDELPDLGGACAYSVYNGLWIDERVLSAQIAPDRWGGDGVHGTRFSDYIYVIAGDQLCDDGGDDDEICIVDAEVIAIASAPEMAKTAAA